MEILSASLLAMKLAPVQSIFFFISHLFDSVCNRIKMQKKKFGTIQANIELKFVWKCVIANQELMSKSILLYNFFGLSFQNLCNIVRTICRNPNDNKKESARPLTFSNSQMVLIMLFCFVDELHNFLLRTELFNAMR